MSDELGRKLEEVLAREAGGREADLGWVVDRGRRLRGRRMTFMATAGVAAIAIAWVAVASPYMDTSDPQIVGPAEAPDSAEPDEDGASNETDNKGCPVSQGQIDQTEWTSPTTYIAGGSFNDEDWVLCARTVENTEASEEGLCMNWRLGDSLGSGMNCVFTSEKGQAVPLDEDYFSPVMGPDEGYLFGAAPADSAAVELVKDDGTSIAGHVYPAPHELGVPFTFFTIFEEPYTEGQLVLRDDTGEILVQRRMTHGLSQLLVTLAGDGEGSVRGYRTENLEFFEECRRDGQNDCRQPRQRWIDCPDQCAVGLDDARITLIADPSEDSSFAGWSGACFGRDRCELTVDRYMEVEATFRRT